MTNTDFKLNEVESKATQLWRTARRQEADGSVILDYVAFRQFAQAVGDMARELRLELRRLNADAADSG